MKSVQKFIAVDVETANHNIHSICQIGIAIFEDGVLTDEKNIYINPEEKFNQFNSDLHQINAETVKDSPTFSDIYEELNDILKDNIVIHHTFFDKKAINQVCIKYDLPLISARWIDSARIARRTWTQFKDSGFGLANLTDFLDIKFKHHDALEDAIATGKMVVCALTESETDIEDWFVKVEQSIVPRIQRDKTAYFESLKKEGNPEGELYGETITFSGNFFLTKDDMGAIAANMGCNVESSVNKKITMFVYGTQVKSVLKGETKSTKHRKVENMILKGADIQILSEDDFLKLFNPNQIFPWLKKNS